MWHGTYTFQEAKELLGGDTPDEDALTRGQQKKIEDIQSEKPSPKKAKMSKHTTMAATAKVCKRNDPKFWAYMSVQTVQTWQSDQGLHYLLLKFPWLYLDSLVYG